MIARLLVVGVLSLSHAPFQCASDPDSSRRLEDTPSEALWALAERFRAQGNEDARLMALQEITDRYPSSAEAERARITLDGRDVPPDPRRCAPVDRSGEDVSGESRREESDIEEEE